jgi:hypothetical protein
MEGFMNSVSLRSVHPVESKEMVPLGIWLITRVVIGSVFVVMTVPFVMYYLGG